MSVIKVQRTIRASSKKAMTRRHSIRELTRAYFLHERRWHFAIEALLFAIIAVISAWPIFAAAEALNEFLQQTAI